MIRAIAYSREYQAAGGCTTGRSGQLDAIRKYAAAHGIEIVAWFEDEAGGDDLLQRPGIRALLNYSGPYDLLIFEQARVLSGSMAVLEPFLDELDRRNIRYESAVSKWDVVSQQLRRRSRTLSVLPQPILLPEAGKRYRVAKPVRFHFAHLVHHADPPVSPRV